MNKWMKKKKRDERTKNKKDKNSMTRKHRKQEQQKYSSQKNVMKTHKMRLLFYPKSYSHTHSPARAINGPWVAKIPLIAVFFPPLLGMKNNINLYA